MAEYTIPQNVEAEDKLIGPFSFKQFIFLIITAVGILLAWLFYRIAPLMALVPLPVILVFGILGLYRREDQPVETYLMAALNYYLRPRRRLWNPEGIIETVHITAPKKMARAKTKKLGEAEYSQLEKLARIIDTRGWAIKRPELTEATDAHQPLDTDDRLGVQASVGTVEPLDVHTYDDILDPYNNPKAQDFQALAQASQDNARSAAIAKMQAVQAEQSGTPAPAATGSLPTNVSYNPYPSMKQKVIGPSPSEVKDLANNNDLTVSGIAAQAERKAKG